MAPSSISQNTYPWVFLRGLIREKNHWGDFASQFEKRFSTQAICIDFLGVGEFFQQTSPRSIARFSDHVWQQIKDKRLDRVNLFSISMGSMVASDLMVKHPDKINAAVWINTSFGNYSKSLKRINLKKIGSYLHFLKNFSIPEKREKMIYQLSTQIHQNPKIVERWVELAKEKPTHISTLLNQLIAASQSTLNQKPTSPVLVLQSAKDELVDPQCTLDFCNALQMPYVTHPTAGHDIPLDDPEWVLTQVETWMNSL